MVSLWQGGATQRFYVVLYHWDSTNSERMRDTCFSQLLSGIMLIHENRIFPNRQEINCCLFAVEEKKKTNPHNTELQFCIIANSGHFFYLWTAVIF